METGYEASFDFPDCAGPSLFYLIATVPRTGSTFLSHLLWRTGCLGAPLEYLNFDPDGPYAFAKDDAFAQQSLWHAALRRRTSPNGVFGTKCFPVQMAALQDHNLPLLNAVIAALMRDPGSRKIIYLERRDRAAHAASFARAALSGVWREEQEAGLGEAPAYSEQAMAEVDRGIDAMIAVWERTFRQLGIVPLRLAYEDVVADPDGAVAAVANYLGVTIDPGAAVAVPEVRKQSAAELGDWAERYGKVRGA